jgi:hypothetical protein
MRLPAGRSGDRRAFCAEKGDKRYRPKEARLGGVRAGLLLADEIIRACASTSYRRTEGRAVSYGAGDPNKAGAVE